MTTKAYKINIRHEENAKKLKMTMGQYVDYLDKLVNLDRNREQEIQLTKIEKLEGIVQSNINYQISQRAKDLTTEKKLDDIIKSNALLKQVFTAKLKFIDELEKELSK
ncbi:hypothetical protein SAMN05192566_0738 [Methylophilus rhizosphaerae]|uniref:Uncharacterized protein n=1 Tax=Methylophilus rhizosphaerae TaxID=492660 RepID=A0A1G9A9E7_9PROT|nr:hypothetical protein [Methylophilus rhizosphaerae]SDK23454.1 hypothetical protein SAMN05192566_0738 [Methylophilus rhizosphaerae]